MKCRDSSFVMWVEGVGGKKVGLCDVLVFVHNSAISCGLRSAIAKPSCDACQYDAFYSASAEIGKSLEICQISEKVEVLCAFLAAAVTKMWLDQDNLVMYMPRNLMLSTFST